MKKILLISICLMYISSEAQAQYFQRTCSNGVCRLTYVPESAYSNRFVPNRFAPIQQTIQVNQFTPLSMPLYTPLNTPSVFVKPTTIDEILINL